MRQRRITTTNMKHISSDNSSNTKEKEEYQSYPKVVTAKTVSVIPIPTSSFRINNNNNNNNNSTVTNDISTSSSKSNNNGSIMKNNDSGNNSSSNNKANSNANNANNNNNNKNNQNRRAINNISNNKKQSFRKMQKKIQEQIEIENETRKKKWLFIGMILFYIILGILLGIHFLSSEQKRPIQYSDLAQPMKQNYNRFDTSNNNDNVEEEYHRMQIKMAETRNTATRTKIQNIDRDTIQYSMEYKMEIIEYVPNKKLYRCDLIDYDNDENNVVGRDLLIITNNNRYFQSYEHFTNSAIYDIDNFTNDRIFYELCRAGNEHNGLLTTVSVIEIDINTINNNDQQELLKLLYNLLYNNKIYSLPLGGIITPNDVSSTIIIDYIQYSGNIQSLTQRIALHWIPINSYSISTQLLSSIINNNNDDDVAAIDNIILPPSIITWPILAIYGSNDQLGKESAYLLQKYTNNTIVKEVTGGKDCDIDSPVEFATTVIKYLQTSFNNNNNENNNNNQNKKYKEEIYNVRIDRNNNNNDNKDNIKNDNNNNNNEIIMNGYIVD